MTEEQIAQFVSLYEAAHAILGKYLILGDFHPKQAEGFDRADVKQAINLFEQCLAIVPDHWQSVFFIGKAYQSLDQKELALAWLEKALVLEQTNADVAREASIQAVLVGDMPKAVRYSAEALNRGPHDVGLVGNHAMNLFLIGKDEEANALIDRVISLQPDDQINKNIKQLITSVRAGRRKRPTPQEVFGIKIG